MLNANEKEKQKVKNQLNPAIIYVSTLKLSLAFISIDILLLNVINVCYIIAEMNIADQNWYHQCVLTLFRLRSIDSV